MAKRSRRSAPPKIDATIKPDAKARDAYEAAYRRYVQNYPAIKEIYRS